MKWLVVSGWWLGVGGWGLAASAADDLVGNETWGGRKAHPAVVNSVTAIKDDPNVISLRGTWDLILTPSGNQRNTPPSYYFKGGVRSGIASPIGEARRIRC